MKPVNRTSMLGAALTLTLSAGVTMAREAPTMTVAVIDFTNDTSSANWWNGDVGRQLADVLSNELSATGGFKVIERQKIDAVLVEQDLAASSRMRPGSSPHTGNITGAQYLVTGSVAAYTEDTSNTGGGLNIAGFRVGGGKSEAYVAIDLMVKRDGCEARYQQKEQRRRENTKKTLDLD